MTVVSGSVTVPGSKSVTHRAYLVAAQSDQPCTVQNPLRGADTDATLACLHSLGYRMNLDQGEVRFLPANPIAPREALDCRNSGTTLRLLAGHAATLTHPVILTGDESLQARPNGPLLAALRSLGVTTSESELAPISVRGPMRPGNARLPAKVSSQYGSSILLAMSRLAGDSTLVMDEPISSEPYLELTLDVARAFGVRIEREGNQFHVPGGQTPRVPIYRVEGDWSTAAFPFCAAAITGGEVAVRGLNLQSRQGDKAVIDILQKFGCTVSNENEAVRLHGEELVSPGAIDVSMTPDLFPPLCIVAACSKGTTTFTSGAALRHKESNRIATMQAGLQTLGIDCEETEDGLIVKGGQLCGGQIQAHDDHRVHMAFTIAGLAAKGKVHVDSAQCAAVSYPNFHADLAKLTEVVA